MRTKKLLKLSCLAFVFAMGSSSSNCTYLMAAGVGGLSGVVRDSRGLPLAGVVVSLLHGQFNPRVVKTVTTDGSGRFEIKEVSPGLYSLKAHLISYLPSLVLGVDVVADKIADLNLILENLYLQTVLGVSGKDRGDLVHEDIKAVLRQAASTRPILRIVHSSGDDLESDHQSGRQNRGFRGTVGFSTAAYSTAPDLVGLGNAFTDFVLAKDFSGSTTWVVAGIVSDSGFAELDSLVRFRTSEHHRTSARLSVGILPYLGPAVSPVVERNLRNMNMYDLDLEDEFKLSDSMSVLYGTELQLTDPTTSAARFRPRFGIKFQPRVGSGYSFMRTTSLPQFQRNLDVGEGEKISITSPIQNELGNRLNVSFNRVTHTETSTQQVIAGIRFGAAAYSDESFVRSSTGQTAPPEASMKRSRGLRISAQRSISQKVDGTVGYTYGTGTESFVDQFEMSSRNFHVLAARLNTNVPVTETHIVATYRWISGDSITIIDPYQEVFESSSPGFSLMFVQAIPYLGRLVPGRLEAQIDMRNLLAKANPDLYRTANFRRVDFLQPARSVRGGIQLKF